LPFLEAYDTMKPAMKNRVGLLMGSLGESGHHLIGNVRNNTLQIFIIGWAATNPDTPKAPEGRVSQAAG